MLHLPPASHPARDLFSVADLADWKALPTFRQAKDAARAFMAADTSAHSVNSVAICADGSVKLVRFGPRGGVYTEWNFGNPVA